MKQIKFTKEKTNYIVVAQNHENPKYYALIKLSDGLINNLEQFLDVIGDLCEIGKNYTLKIQNRKYVVFLHEILIDDEGFKQEFTLNIQDGFAYALIDDSDFMKLQYDFERRFGSYSPELTLDSDLCFQYDFEFLDRESEKMVYIYTLPLCTCSFI